MEAETNDLREYEHHKQSELCKTRPAYRQGKKLTSVKVYTINNESPHLFIYGVPSINLRTELKSLCDKYGKIKKIYAVKDVRTEVFTECFHVHYERIQSARIAKRFIDSKNFYGGILHVCYAPEQESVDETRKKLFQRTKDVLTRLNPSRNPKDSVKQKFPPLDMTRLNRKRKHPALEITEEKLAALDSDAVWNGVPEELDPRKPKQMKLKPCEPVKHFQKSVPLGNIYGPSASDFKNVSNDHTLNCDRTVESEGFVPVTSNSIDLNGDESLENDKEIVDSVQCFPNLIPNPVIKAVKCDIKKQIKFHTKRKFNLV